MVAYPLTLDNRLAAQMQAQTYAEFVASTSLDRNLLALRRSEARVDPDTQWFLASFPDVLHWVIVVSEDAPECAVLLPCLARLAACSVRIDLRIVCEGDGLDALVAWLDESGAGELLNDPDLPLLLIFDEEWQLQEQWGPYPQAMEELLDNWLERHPNYETLADDESPASQAEYALLLDSLIWEMRIWFNTELDRACGTEIAELVRSLIDDESDAPEDENGVEGEERGGAV